MDKIKKVSEITPQDVADYIRLDELTDDETNTLDTLIEVSKAFIVQYTGRSAEELDNYPEMVIVVLILCQDMYDNRTLYVDKAGMNRAVETILSLHCVNLL